MKHYLLALACLLALASCNSTEKKIEEAAREGRLSVTLFGAKGDGVTDDTEAIQRAIDYLDARGGGKLFFPYTREGYLIAAPAKEYAPNGRLVRAQLILPPGGSTIQFEGETFMAPARPHAYVGNIYANYMTLPPENQRKGHAVFYAETLKN